MQNVQNVLEKEIPALIHEDKTLNYVSKTKIHKSLELDTLILIPAEDDEAGRIFLFSFSKILLLL